MLVRAPGNLVGLDDRLRHQEVLVDHLLPGGSRLDVARGHEHLHAMLVLTCLVAHVGRVQEYGDDGDNGQSACDDYVSDAVIHAAPLSGSLPIGRSKLCLYRQRASVSIP